MHPPALKERHGVLTLANRTVNWDDRQMITRGQKCTVLGHQHLKLFDYIVDSLTKPKL